MYKKYFWFISTKVVHQFQKNNIRLSFDESPTSFNLFFSVRGPKSFKTTALYHKHELSFSKTYLYPLSMLIFNGFPYTEEHI